MKRILFFAFFLVSVAHAEGLTKRATECLCDPKSSDKFDEALQYDFGPFKDACVNMCKFRKPILLPRAEAKKYRPTKGEIVIANFLHEKKYWIAVVPVAAVDEVILVWEEFLADVSHVAVRYRFKKGHEVRLYPQQDPTSKSQLLSDLVVSAEAVPPKGEPFSLWRSSLGHYLFTYRVLSLHDVIDWMVLDKKHRVRQFALELDAEARQGSLRTLLAESDKKSYQVKYSLFGNNCATNAIDGLTQLRKNENLDDVFGIRAFERGIPVDRFYGTLRTLERLGLMSSAAKAELPNLKASAL